MSTLGICIVSNVQQDSVNNGRFYIQGYYTGIVPSNRINQTFFDVGNVDPTALAATLEGNIKTIVKNILINTHGYTFGLLDDVRLIGSLL